MQYVLTEDEYKVLIAADPHATGVDYSLGYVAFEGRQYVNACPCWHRRAARVVDWIRQNDEQLAHFLRLEKARAVKEANQRPTA